MYGIGHTENGVGNKTLRDLGRESGTIKLVSGNVQTEIGDYEVQDEVRREREELGGEGEGDHENEGANRGFE